MASNKNNLVIVESPAKAKTIGKYLGAGYTVRASMGHLRDLPKSTLGVDIENDFTPQYIAIKGRSDVINELKSLSAKSDKVILATDPDREGEAISWHLKELLKLDDSKACRVTFNEITKKVVTESIKKPRSIDMNIVDAQQARRIIDRIVGYKLSPLLWKKIRRGLSAGRVQSVAVRMVVDRENEIREFVPDEYWTIDAVLSPENSESNFIAKFWGKNGKKTELKSSSQVQSVIDTVSGQKFTVKSIKRSDKSRNPSPPFTTSTLQQEASRKLGMTPKKTMAVAQMLYEGVELSGEGSVGLITYMRTDSLRISEEALASCGDFVKSRYGDSYYPGAPRRFKTKSGAQDAHEAIRPSDVTRTPESLRAQLTADQYKLYRLIWSRYVASQMAAAIYDSVTIDTECASYVFRSSSTAIKFPGFTALYEEGKDEDNSDPNAFLPLMNEGDLANLIKISSEQKFTQPPTRYTEATLIKAMEETGVGRPSTYAPIISTIMERNYVVKDGKYLTPTPLGETVNSLMIDKFPDIVDLGFTAGMENKLDEVENGKLNYIALLKEFYAPFEKSLSEAESTLEGTRIKVPDEVSDEVCEVCGRQMVVKTGRFGRFLACPGFPECTFTKPIVETMPGKCPKCGSRILKRTSKKGYTYYACEHVKECGFMTWDVPVADNCPSCGKTMFKKSGKGYKKPFCTNEACPMFVPEDKRGYTRKSTDAEKTAVTGKENEAANTKKGTSKSTATKKTAKSGTKKKPESASKGSTTGSKTKAT